MKSLTNIGGLLSAIGISISSAGILTQLTQLFPDGANIPHGVLVACWYIAVVGVFLKLVGAGMTSYFAADNSDLKAVKQLVLNPLDVKAPGPVEMIPPQNPEPTKP